MTDEDYDDIDLLIDTNPIELGRRCRVAEHYLREVATWPTAAATDIRRYLASLEKAE